MENCSNIKGPMHKEFKSNMIENNVAYSLPHVHYNIYKKNTWKKHVIII